MNENTSTDDSEYSEYDHYTCQDSNSGVFYPQQVTELMANANSEVFTTFTTMGPFVTKNNKMLYSQSQKNEISQKCKMFKNYYGQVSSISLIILSLPKSQKSPMTMISRFNDNSPFSLFLMMNIRQCVF